MVDRALAKSPDERFENAAAMAAALRNIGHDVRSAHDRFEWRGADRSGAALAGSGRPPPGTGTAPPAIDDPSLATIERRLASYLGPMAAYKLRHALTQSRTAIEFCELLSLELPEGATRDNFMRDAMDLLSRGPVVDGTAAKQAAAREAAELDILTRALARVMGPIAPHLVRRAQARGLSAAELEAACAAMIDNPQQRARFGNLLAQYRGNIADHPSG